MGEEETAVDHESRVHDADAVPPAHMNAEDASPRDEAPPAGQDAVTPQLDQYLFCSSTVLEPTYRRALLLKRHYATI